MIGARPASWREYLWPNAFAYYVPSILIATLPEPAFFDLALEAILPSNQQRHPRGDWWLSFGEAFSEPQRQAIRGFAVELRTSRSETFDLTARELISAVETIWA